MAALKMPLTEHRDNFNPAYWSVHDASGRLVAHFVIAEEATEAVRLCNAHAGLVEALRECKKAMCNTHECSCEGEARCKYDVVVNARAALALAEGGGQ